MQAVILAAGMGKRLGDLTKENTKAMINVNGITLIERMLEQLDNRKFERIVIVTGYQSERLIQYITSLQINTPITYIHNPIYNQTNNIYSLYLAKDYLVEKDTILFESDLIFEDTVLDKLINHPFPNLALVAKFESWMDGTVLTIDENDYIKHFIAPNNFSYEEIPFYYKTVNIYKFSKEFSSKYYVPFLIAYSTAIGNNEYYEQVLRVITLLDKKELKILRLDKNEFWYEIDDIQDLDIAESIFANEDDKIKKIEQRYGGYWRYPALLDFCYLVNPFFPNSKLLAEIKSNFGRLISEYPSGLKVNNLLAAKFFNLKQDYIIVGNGAAELINSWSNSQVNKQGNIGMIFPIFEEYPNRFSSDRVISFIPSNDEFKYSAEDLIDYFENKYISALLIINPDNPSGNYLDHSSLIKLCDWTKLKNIQFIVDESFVDFAKDTSPNTLLENSTLERYPHLLVIKSISKSYGVPGLRLGVLASSNIDTISSIRKEVSIWNINSFAEFFMQIYGKYEAEYKESCKLLIQEREFLYEKLQKINWLRVIPSQANYLLCEIKEKYTASRLTQILLNKNILIKDCSNKKGFSGKNYIRIAVRSRDENTTLVDILNSL